MIEAAAALQRHFATTPRALVRAPGRVELLGNHTDYNQGLVMALAVDKYITLAAAPRDDDQVELVSTAFDRPATFSLNRIHKDEAAPWANYVKGLILQLLERGAPVHGYSAAIHSTIPLGAGLSSSAALLVATALLLRKLYPYALNAEGRGVPVPPLGNAELPALTAADKMLLARVCQAAENQFVGVNCGLLDHISSLYGQADHVILIDCLKLAVDWTPFSGDIAVVVCHSGVRHALVGGEYNERRRNCEGAARALGAPSLRFVNLASLENGRSRLTPAQYSCALHVVGENDRVQRGAGMLRSGDIASFGQLLFQSHESSRHNFHNSCPELDVLVELAKTQAACLGARLTGGGFGGATINLVKRDAAEEFRTRMAAGYAAKTGHKLESWICSVVDGAA